MGLIFGSKDQSHTARKHFINLIIRISDVIITSVIIRFFFRLIFGSTFLPAIWASRNYFGGFSADKNSVANPAIGYG